MSGKPKIAIATGDRAGIGPEIGLKAALDPAVRSACDPIVFSEPSLIERQAKVCGIKLDMHVVESDADWSGNRLNILVCAQPIDAKVFFLAPTVRQAGAPHLHSPPQQSRPRSRAR